MEVFAGGVEKGGAVSGYVGVVGYAVLVFLIRLGIVLLLPKFCTVNVTKE